MLIHSSLGDFVSMCHICAQVALEKCRHGQAQWDTYVHHFGATVSAWGQALPFIKTSICVQDRSSQPAAVLRRVHLRCFVTYWHHQC